MITIKLRPLDTNDIKRTIKLSDSAVPIGRASKTEARGATASADNALFECPVISRDHAEFRHVMEGKKIDRVTITDLGSMHGTYVNNQKLTRYDPFTLHDGDLIRFGTVVARGQGKCFEKEKADQLTIDTGDTYQGVSVLYGTDIDLSPSGRILNRSTYMVPEPEDEEEVSNYGSEVDSLYDSQDISSAYTTPEGKKDLGSQAKPIEVEQWSAGSLREVLDITEDVQEPDSARLDDENPYATSDHAEDDCDGDVNLDDDHAEDDYAEDVNLDDDHDSYADGLCEDDVNGDDTDEIPEQKAHVVPDSFRPDEASYSSRAASVELGEVVHAQWTAHDASTFSKQPATTSACTAGTRYDPVRGYRAVPTLPEKHNDAPEPAAYPTPCGLPPRIPPWASYVTAGQVSHNPYAASRAVNNDWLLDTTRTTQAYPVSTNNFTRIFKDEGPAPVMPAFPTLDATSLKPAVPMPWWLDAAQVQSTSEVQKPAGQMAIPSILAEQPNTEAAVTDTVKESKSVDAPKKRKAQDTSDKDESDIVSKVSSRKAEATLDQLEQRPKKKAKVQRSNKPTPISDIRKYTVGAALGMTGTFTLLASPLGGMLVDWVNKL